MPDTSGFSVVVEAGPAVLRKAFRGAWKSALCPEDPGDQGRIPEHLDIAEADGMRFGPYEIIDAQVQIPLEDIDAQLAPDIDGAQLQLGLEIQAEIKDPPVPSAALFDFRAQVRAKAPVGVPTDQKAVFVLLGALTPADLTVTLPDGDPLASKLDAFMDQYVHLLYEQDGPAFPHTITELNKQWPLGFATATVDVYAEMYDDESDPARRIVVSRPQPDRLQISIPIYMRLFNIRPPALVSTLGIVQPFAIETRLNLIAPFSTPPGHVIAELAAATVTVDALAPAGGAHAEEGANYAAIPGLIKGQLDPQIAAGITERGRAMAQAMGTRDILVPTPDEIATAIRDLFHAELQSRGNLSVWTPVETPEIALSIDNVASRVHPDFLAIGINAGAGADIGALASFIPGGQEFAIGLNAAQMEAAFDAALADAGLDGASLPKTINSDDDEVRINSVGVGLVDSAIRITGNVTVIDAILGSIDVDADFRSDIGLEWADNPDGTQRMQHVQLGEPEIDPEESVLFWVIALIIGVVTGGIGGGIIALIVLVVIKLVVDGIAQSIGAAVVTDEISGNVVGLGGWPSRLSRIGRVTTRFANPIVVDSSGLTIAGTVEVISSCEATPIAFAKTSSALTATAGAPTALTAGRLHASALYSWRPGDGTGASAVQDLTHVYTASGHYIAKHGLTINEAGGAATRHFASVTIENVPPTADAGPDITVKEGEVITLTGRFWDIEPWDTHETSWVFGDNQPPKPGVVSETHSPPKGFGTSTVDHAWCDNGTYTLVFTVRDQNGGVVQDTRTVTVLNVPPVVDAGKDLFAYRNTPVLLCAAFEDAGWCDRHVATWDAGDCTGARTAVVREINAPPAARGTAALAHVYDDCGVYHAVCRVTDDDGASGTDAITVRVVSILNPGFEKGYRDLKVGRVANSWSPYSIAPRPAFPSQNTAASAASNAAGSGGIFECEECVVRGGQRSQRIEPLDGNCWGIFQTVGANREWLYQVAAWFTIDGSGTVRLGLDPDGGDDPTAPQIVWTEATKPGDWLQLCQQVCASGDGVTVFLEAEPDQRGALKACVDDVELVVMACNCCCEPGGWERTTGCDCGTDPSTPPPPPPPRPDRRCLELRDLSPQSDAKGSASVVVNGFTLRDLSGMPLHIVPGANGAANGVMLNPGGIGIALPFAADRAIATILYRGGKPAVFEARGGDGQILTRVESDSNQMGVQTVTLAAPGMLGVIATGQETILHELCIEAAEGTRDIKSRVAMRKYQHG